MIVIVGCDLCAIDQRTLNSFTFFQTHLIKVHFTLTLIYVGCFSTPIWDQRIMVNYLDQIQDKLCIYKLLSKKICNIGITKFMSLFQNPDISKHVSWLVLKTNRKLVASEPYAAIVDQSRRGGPPNCLEN